MKKSLPSKKWLVFFSFLFESLAFSKELPTNLELKYELTQSGELLGTVIEKFVTDETGRYRIESATKGIGLYALFEYRDWETDRKSTRLNSSHLKLSRMPSSA